MVVSGAAQAHVAESALKNNAPAEYIVKRGDTLYGISATYLKSPWLWPQAWTKNSSGGPSHRIYPGDVVVLTKSGGKASLSLSRGVKGIVKSEGAGVVYLSPRPREEDDNQAEAIAAIPGEAIAPFLRDNLIVQSKDAISTSMIVAMEEGRMNVGNGSKAYANIGAENQVAGTTFDVYEAPAPVQDSDSDAVLGFEAVRLGTAHVVRPGDASRPATIVIDSASREIGAGSLLAPSAPKSSGDFYPHAASTPISGHILKLHDTAGTKQSEGSRTAFDTQYEHETGTMSVVMINKGIADGVEAGQIFTLARAGRTITPRGTFGFSAGEKVAASTTLPSEQYGEIMVFKAFDRVAYALIMKAGSPVNVGDEFTTPQQ